MCQNTHRGHPSSFAKKQQNAARWRCCLPAANQRRAIRHPIASKKCKMFVTNTLQHDFWSRGETIKEVAQRKSRCEKEVLLATRERYPCMDQMVVATQNACRTQRCPLITHYPRPPATSRAPKDSTRHRTFRKLIVKSKSESSSSLSSQL